MEQMKRLTVKRKDGRWALAGNGTPTENMMKIPVAVDRLAALEDIIFAADGTPRLTLERLTELAQADAEGRCVLQPASAKEGDPKPDCFEDYGGSLWCLGYQQSETDDEPCDRCKRCWYCEDGDYADDCDEAAEAAMEGRDENS